MAPALSLRESLRARAVRRSHSERSSRSSRSSRKSQQSRPSRPSRQTTNDLPSMLRDAREAAFVEHARKSHASQAHPRRSHFGLPSLPSVSSRASVRHRADVGSDQRPSLTAAWRPTQLAPHPPATGHPRPRPQLIRRRLSRASAPPFDGDAAGEHEEEASEARSSGDGLSDVLSGESSDGSFDEDEWADEGGASDFEWDGDEPSSSSELDASHSGASESTRQTRSSAGDFSVVSGGSDAAIDATLVTTMDAGSFVGVVATLASEQGARTNTFILAHDPEDKPHFYV